MVFKKVSKKATIKASQKVVSRKIKANDEIIDDEIVDDVVEDEVIDDAPVEEEQEVEVAPEATDLLFEAEDVAELIAEISGQDVAVTAEEDKVTFEVGDDEYIVEAEGDEEILESTKVTRAGKAPVTASKRVARKAVRR